MLFLESHLRPCACFCHMCLTLLVSIVLGVNLVSCGSQHRLCKGAEIIHRSSLIWSKQKVLEKKELGLVIHLQLWEVTHEVPLSTTTNNSVSARVSQQQLARRREGQKPPFLWHWVHFPQPTTMNHNGWLLNSCLILFDLFFFSPNLLWAGSIGPN
jgi:hypothetical protein